MQAFPTQELLRDLEMVVIAHRPNRREPEIPPNSGG
jgi:hypothetical protein